MKYNLIQKIFPYKTNETHKYSIYLELEMHA